MRASLIALKLTLDALELPIYHAFCSLCSNGLYLSQTYALDLGYHFHSHNGHPSSDQFLEDFVALTEALESGDRDHYPQRLIPRLHRPLATLCSYLEPAHTVSLTRTEWIALLADIAFLTHTHPERLSALPVAWQHRCAPADISTAHEILRQLPLLLSSPHLRHHDPSTTLARKPTT